jgi:hypothetical protein
VLNTLIHVRMLRTIFGKRERKWRMTGENCIKKSFKIALHHILIG